MDRRTFLIRVGALGAVGAVAAACGSDKASVGTVEPTGDTTSPATASSVAETAAPTVAATEPAPTLNELRIGLPGDTTNVDGDKATLGMQSPNANIYERLVHMTDDFEIEPWLAESWEFVEPNTWRFHLRKDVTFQDGSPLTASDVVWTLDRVGRAGGRNINAAEGATVAVDDHTVEFTPVKPNRKVPLQIVHPNYGIMKKGSDPINAPVGTGPFSFVSYKAKESFKVVRNGAYWNAAKAAQSSGITFFYLPDANARILALQSGDLDAITEVPRESVAQVAAAGFVVEKSAVGAYEAMLLTVRGTDTYTETKDPVLRKAIAMAVDRKSIVDVVWEGNAEYGRTMVPPAVLGKAAEGIKGGPKFDLAGAKALLEGAGYVAGSDGMRSKDGKALELTLVSGFPSPDIHRPIPEVLQQQLAAAGIGVKIVEATDYSAALGAVEGHLWMERGNQNDANPAFLPGFLFVSEEAGGGGPYAHAFAVGAAVDKPMAAAQATEDIVKTQQFTADALKALIDDEIVVIPIAGVTNIWAHSAKANGPKPHAAFVHTDLSRVSVSA